MKNTPFIFTLILTAIAAVAAVTECAAQMEYLERSETEGPTVGFALRRVILETGPEVHTVMVFDTLPRIRSDELNIRIHYWERHMPQMGPQTHGEAGEEAQGSDEGGCSDAARDILS